MSAAAPYSSAALSAAQPATLATDAFDAVVQAANPSHPNHAVWVEKFGGSLPKRGGAASAAVRPIYEDDDDQEYMRRSSSVGRRGRRASNGASSAHKVGLRDRLPPPKDIDFGRGHSRFHTTAVDGRPMASKGVEATPSELLDGSTITREEHLRRKKKKRREKGKEKPAAPPVPPPRTTSHGLHHSPPLDPVPVYPSGSMPPPRSGPGSGPDPGLSTVHTPTSPLSTTNSGSAHSRNTSLSQYATASSHSTMEPAMSNGTSTLTMSPSTTPRRVTTRGRLAGSSAQAPTRLSSMASRMGGGESAEVSTARMAAKMESPTVAPGSASPSVNGSSRKSVEFALPAEPEPGRRSLDTTGIRRSFDMLTSPFRSSRKTASRLDAIAMENDHYKPAKPILRSSSFDLSSRAFLNSPPAASHQGARALSSVQDEPEASDRPLGSSRQLSGQSHELTPPALLSVHTPKVVAASPFGGAKRSGNSTEDGDDFYDARSDEGGNGSSAEEKKQQQQRQHNHNADEGLVSADKIQTPARRRGKRKSSEYYSATRARAKTVASGLGVEGFFPPFNAREEKPLPKAKVDSSASESDEAVGPGHIRPSPRKVGLPSERQKWPKSDDDQMPERSERSRNDTARAVLSTAAYQATKGQSANVVANGEHAQLPKLPRLQEHFRSPSPTTKIPSYPSPPHLDRVQFKEDDAPSPHFVQLPSAGSSSTLRHAGNSASEATFSPKSLGRTGKGLAGVMARMRRDKNAAPGIVKGDNPNETIDSVDSPTMSSGNFHESERNGHTLGLGIATPVLEGSGSEAPVKRWRNRLPSFSGKSARSPKAEQDEWMREQMLTPPPLPPMPPKAMRVLLTNRFGKPGDEVDVLRERTAVEGIRGAHTAPLESREFVSNDKFHNGVTPTIHKTLSPALLTQLRHEADEVNSFIGSDGDSEGKRATWNSFKTFELPPEKTVQPMTTSASMPVGIVGGPVTQSPTIDDSGVVQVLENGRPISSSSGSLTKRRFSYGSPKLMTRASEGFLRKAPPPALHLSPSPPPVPSTPEAYRVESVSPAARESPQLAIPRRSLDTRLTSWSRNKMRGSPQEAGEGVEKLRKSSFNISRDRLPIFSPTLKESISSPKLGKRFFATQNGAVGSASPFKAKQKSKGISSSDYAGPISYSPVKGMSFELASNSREEKEEMLKRNSDRIEGMDDGILKAQEATKLLAVHTDHMCITPTSSRIGSQPPTPAPLSSANTTDEYFDRMLRERALDDAARLKQIAQRTAHQAQAQASLVEQ